MSSTLPTRADSSPGFLADYPFPKDAYDEMFAAPGQLRPHCELLANSVERLGASELQRRWEQAQRLIHENGITYSAYGDPDDTNRPWDLDSLPLMIPAREWQILAAGLTQRAELLNQIAADLYGPQELLRREWIPANLLFSHPGFFRQFHGQKPPENCFIHLYAADLARSADGRWWVVGDRTDSPMGGGYALENRIVTARIMPLLIRECRAERLASFYLTLQETLRRIATGNRENPRIVILSQGPHSVRYFEDVYLARYLGYTLVEAGDLSVREDRVYIKTLGGLLQVDVILRRLGDRHCDPLELRGDPAIGIPGLLQVVRAGNVVVANTLGSSIVESPALVPYLPHLCRELLKADLQLPSVATWWCGTEAERQYVLDNRQQLVMRPAYRRLARGWPQINVPTDPGEVEAAIRRQPVNYVGRERVKRSSIPVWTSGGLKSAQVALRAYVVWANGKYQVMPGALVRVAEQADPLDVSILAGEGSKDCWILSEGPVRDVSLLKPAGESLKLRRSGAELPSRVADNLFWLGRNFERTDALARLLRMCLVRLSNESETNLQSETSLLLEVLACRLGLDPAALLTGGTQSIETALMTAVLDEGNGSSLRSAVAAAFRNASLVRDRISIDSWRIINRIDGDLDTLAQHPKDLGDAMFAINGLLVNLAAFTGLVGESMTRTPGWRFLDLGRRLERAMHIIDLVHIALVGLPDDGGPVLEAVLDVADSLMTYRSRYLARLQLAPALDLLLTDETNPRSLAYQLVALADHVDNLPRDRSQPLRGPEQRITLDVLNSVRLVDVEVLTERQKESRRVRLDKLLTRLAEQLPRLSDLISHRYFVHSTAPRHLAEIRPLPSK